LLLFEFETAGLRIPLMDQLQSGHYESASAIAAAEPIFEVLKMYFGEIDEDAELPTAAELGVDIIQIVFDGDVQQGILRLQNVLANPEGVPVTGEIRAQMEVFNGIGELLNLAGFKAIVNATLEALEHNSDNPILVGEIAVANFIAARAEVLAGDRAQGGKTSPELIALGQINHEVSNHELANLDTSDDWIKSLEQEIDSFSFLETSLDLSSEIVLEPIIEQPLETIFTESDSNNTLPAIADANLTADLTTNVHKFDDFDPVAFDSVILNNLNLDHPDLDDPDLDHPDLLDYPDLDQVNQNFDIFTANLDDQTNSNEANILDNLNSVFGLLEFDESEENLLIDTVSQPTQPNSIEPEISLEPVPKPTQVVASEVSLAVSPQMAQSFKLCSTNI
jgi:chemotaxis family two-component system sensor histidine kinase/response regulator PixL